MARFLLPFVVLAALAHAAPVSVRYKEGTLYGFLTLRTPQGELVADGDLIQNVRGNRVISRLVYHFKDGSDSDETAVFTQAGSFRLIRDHLVQKGPSFAHPVDMTIDGRTGAVTVRYTEDGHEKTASDRVHAGDGLVNGMVLILLKNLSPQTPETRLAFVVATPKPRLVTLIVRPHGEDPFRTSETPRKATHFVVKIDLGGLTGVLASLFGKEPPDTNVWIYQGAAPAFVKSEGPMAPGTPVWRTELSSPVWPQ